MTDRAIVYAGSIPQDKDVLLTNQYAMLGLGYLALDLLGSSTIASGLACTPTAPASLNVQIAPGRLYSQQNVDNTAYGSLGADTTHQILKQGILADAVSIPCAAPGTFGFSVNYLIQAAYQDLDTNLVTLPYYNIDNPEQPFSGPNNLGTAQATTRSGAVAVTVKPGIAATTGAQTTPAPDVGFVGLWVVTVANGQTSITSANIVAASSAPFSSGSFLGTMTGGTTAPTVQVKWVRNGMVVTAIIPGITVTSNAVTCTITGMPPSIWPTTVQTFGLATLLNAGSGLSPGGIGINTTGVISLIVNASASNFTASGTKGISSPATVSWLLGV